MSKWIAVLLVAFTVACSNPTAPTSVSQTLTAASVTSSPLPSRDNPAPPVASPTGSWWTVDGPTWCVGAMPCKKIWTLTVTSPPRPFHIVAVSSHSDVSSLEPTSERAGNLLRVNGQADYKRGTGGQATFSFDPAEVSCGRTQLDASMIFEDGSEILILSPVEPTGVDCAPTTHPEPPVAPPIEPPPPPPPACTPGDSACDKGGPPRISCVAKGPDATVTGTAYNGNFDFTVLKGAHVLSLVSYILDGVHVYPQKFHERKVQVFSPGHYTWYIEPQWRNRQEDLYCGEYPEGLDLTDDNATYWESKTIAGDASQCEWCVLPGIRGTKNIVWGTF